MPELSKTYDPAAVEAAAYQTWLDEKAFHADPAAGGTPYTIVIPPPNVTGALHLGHAIDGTLQDILIRRKRMQGFNTLWMPGIDHAGIATQAVVEKELKEKENKNRHDIGREALVQRIWQWKEQYGNRIIEQLKRLGASCDWDRTRFTLDEVCARAVRETFFKLFKDGLIYRGQRLVNWDVQLQTAVADDEIFHETVKGGFWTFRYPVKDSSEFIRFSTTRPETMLGDMAVAVHPDDPRYQHLIGKNVLLPLVQREVPIIADEQLVDPKLGTGAVKVTPAHDPNDYAAWQRQKGGIGIINILTPDGKINENGGKYAGLSRHAARERVTQDMDKLGLFEGREDREIPLAHSDRSKTPIEPYLSDQWFVEMGETTERRSDGATKEGGTGASPVAGEAGVRAPSPGTPGEGRGGGLAQLAIDAVADGRVKFFPDRYAKTYLDWLGEKRDWCISRQLWWGHRIPVWTLKEHKCDWTRLAQLLESNEPGIARRSFDTTRDYPDQKGVEATSVAICIAPGRKDLEELIEGLGFTQDPDVLDTWFSSALWPHSTLGWPKDTPELGFYYPTNVLVTGRDIITLWVARMVVAGLYNMGDVPFAHVYIHPTILDGKGERMSKSKGNGVDPVDIIESYGADALRFTLTQMATETQDVRMPTKKDARGRNTSEKFEAGRNFCNKLWNAARFALTNLSDEGQKPEAPNPKPETRSLADRWILSRLARTIETIDQALDEYHFDVYARACYDFFWRDLCDWYIESIKPELKSGAPRRGIVAQVLTTALDGALRLMHPMIPFVTEAIWAKLNEVAPNRAGGHPQLIKARWPEADRAQIDEPAETDFARLQEIVSAIRNLRNDHKVDPRTTVKVTISGDALGAVQQNAATVELLAGCTVNIGETSQAPGAQTSAGGCEVLVEDLVDQNAEQARSAKRREELTRQIAALRGRLANAAYTAKAPPHLVQQTRDQLAAAENELAKL